MWIRYFKTVQHISSIFADHNDHIHVYVFVCFEFATTYKYISTSWDRLIFIPTLQPWIANAVVNDGFITTPTRRKSVLKARKYYAHTVSYSVSHSPAPVPRGYIAIFVQ